MYYLEYYQKIHIHKSNNKFKNNKDIIIIQTMQEKECHNFLINKNNQKLIIVLVVRKMNIILIILQLIIKNLDLIKLMTMTEF